MDLQDSLPTSVANLTKTGAGTGTNNIVASLGSLFGAHFEPFLKLFTTVCELFGLDPSLLPILGLVWVGTRLGARYWHNIIARYIYSITCSSDDDVSDHVRHYISQYKNVKSRSFTVEAKDGGETLLPPETCQYFNFAKHRATTDYQLTPSDGEHGFWYRSRYFWIMRSRIMIPGDNPQEREEFTVSTYSWSLEPLKAFLQFANEDYQRSITNQTPVRYLSNHRYYHGAWKFAKKVPIRPLDTVILGKEKEDTKDDMNNFLKEEDWYRQRGVPYRRGYLFHGPPGTGKSSLAAALAGFYAVDLYVISGNGGLSDDDLMEGFRSLPPRCIVLFEDVDAAGLNRTSRTAVGVMGSQDKVGFSLSGVLNALDGVAASKGRVAILTTNKIGDVDSALIRPGRVDRLVEFSLATKEQVKEIYLTMYRPNHQNNDQLSLLANKFAAQVPNKQISPASIQCYLMDRRTDPELAVTELATWVKGQVKPV